MTARGNGRSVVISDLIRPFAAALPPIPLPMSQPASTQTKKRKISELTLSQVALSAERIRVIVTALKDETVPPGKGDDPLYAVDPGMLEKLEEIANSLEAKASGRAVRRIIILISFLHYRLQTYAFSSMDGEHLDKLNLSYGPFLEIKEQDLQRRSDLSAQAGADKLWSSETLFQHLNMLKDFVAQVSACTHSHGVANLTSSE
jgi:hypothetical protein